MSSAVQSLEVSFFVHMTEDEEKIKRALASLLGGELQEQREEAEGHFGNKIVWVRYHATGNEAESALRAIVSHMDASERRTVLGELGTVLDEHGALYIRLSKQVLLIKGSASLSSSDPIRIKVKPRSYMVRGDPAGLYARLLEGGG